MNTYATPQSRAPASPIVSAAIEVIETASRSRLHSVLTLTSAMSSPLAAMYTQHRKSAPEDGANPAASVFAGSAKTPAPTVVPGLG